jgi:hypothetical protein
VNPNKNNDTKNHHFADYEPIRLFRFKQSQNVNKRTKCNRELAGVECLEKKLKGSNQCNPKQLSMTFQQPNSNAINSDQQD